MKFRIKKVSFLTLALVLTICLESAFGQTRPGSIPPELVGSWHNGNVSMMNDVNLTTGARTASNGSTFTYKFTRDGRFEFVGMIASTMYGCTTTLFNHKTGNVAVDGATMTLAPDKNFWRNTYSCAPKSNKERDYVLEEEKLEFRMKEDEQGRNLICLTNAKGNESCYRQEK